MANAASIFEDMTGKVWLITGCPSGFGLEIARRALHENDKVIAISRYPQKNADLVAEIKSRGGHWLKLDACDGEDVINSTVADIRALHGRIDVLVSNAGYGRVGGIEDYTEAELCAQYDTNVFGLIKVTRAVLPSMRRQGSGTIVSVSSVTGIRAMARVSMYASSKFAVEGFTELLAAEYGCFGVRAIIVEPSAFRTGFASTIGPGSVSDFYKSTPLEQVVDHISHENGSQPGGPVKAAERIVDAVLRKGVSEDAGQLMRLPLGKAADQSGTDKAKQLASNYEAYREVACSADSE